MKPETEYRYKCMFCKGVWNTFELAAECCSNKKVECLPERYRCSNCWKTFPVESEAADCCWPK